MQQVNISFDQYVVFAHGNRAHVIISLILHVILPCCVYKATRTWHLLSYLSNNCISLTFRHENGQRRKYWRPRQCWLK